MTGMNIGEFMDKVYYGDEIEFILGDTTYFIQGNHRDDKFYLTVDYWKYTDGNEPNHDYLLSLICGSAEERINKFETAKIFDGRTIYEAEKDIEVVFG